MRINNSLKNIVISSFCLLIIALLGFVSRKVFLDNLGVEYLGISGLLFNILSMLALVESGIGVSIIYHLYKPLAENDKPKIIALVQLFKKAYAVLAVIILILSIAIYPLVVKVIHHGGGAIPYITIIYFIFVAKNMITYLNAHKVSLINADQKEYVLTRINFVFQIVSTAAKIAILIYTQNYVLYLLIELAIFGIQSLLNGNVVKRRYSYIHTKEKHSIDAEERGSLIRNIKALFLHNIGTFCVFGTDNILISSFLGIITVGLYSNYTMIVGQIGSLMSPLLNGVGASVGNLIAKESTDKSYSIFRVLYFVNFWIYSVGFIVLYNLLEPFINLWLGNGYLLDSFTFLILLVNFYISGLRYSIIIFKSKGGIFVQDKYIPLLEAAINLGITIVLVKYLGLAGILLGTTISTLCTVFWNAPRLVYKYIFKISLWTYFRTYLAYVILTLFTCFITTVACNQLVIENNLLSLLERALICFIIPNFVYVIVFFRTREMIYIKNVLSAVFSNVKVKISESRRWLKKERKNEFN